VEQVDQDTTPSVYTAFPLAALSRQDPLGCAGAVNRCEDLLRFFVAASSLKMDHLRGNRTCCFEEVCRSERPASKQSLQFDNAALHK
jgi:hypothetical protein